MITETMKMIVDPLVGLSERPKLRRQVNVGWTGGETDNLSTLVDTLSPVTTVYLMRIPTPAIDISVCHRAIISSIEAILPEPCDLTVVVLSPTSSAIVLSPIGGQQLNPLQVRAILDRLHSVLQEVLSPYDLSPSVMKSAAILPLAYVPSVDVMQDHLSALNEMLETIVNKRLAARFQPIVNISRGDVFGYEALIRGPQGTVLRRPSALFRVADEARLVSWLDVACQEQCFATAAAKGIQNHLFVNMDAEGLAYLHLYEISLQERAEFYGLRPEMITMEITERQAIEEFPRLIQFIRHIRGQGFKIAIDDAGTGYSSLQAIAVLQPDFIKIDHSLVADIDRDGTRRALLATLTKYARHIGTQVIAEGIETRNELDVLIQMGIDLAQGFLLGKPADRLIHVRPSIREYISERVEHRRLVASGRSYPVERIARSGFTLPPTATIAEAAERLRKNIHLDNIVVVQGTQTLGVISRTDFYRHLDDHKYSDEFYARSITGVMERRPVIIEFDTPIEEAASYVTFRPEAHFDGWVVLTRKGDYAGVVPIRKLIEAVTTMQINQAKYANPLTELAGRVALEQETNERIEKHLPLTIIYADLDNFKPYNDQHGFTAGDEVIMATANALETALTSYGGPGDLLGHIGGDDFVILTSPECAEPFAREAIKLFSTTIAKFYTVDELQNGFVTSVDRQGITRTFPLITISLAGVNTLDRNITSFVHASDVLAEVKTKAKATAGNVFILDRRRA
ncbi:MAG: EAL and GGDEF domain-containing protein [Armatimonadetes bacterium]|nr:EAL and GGDEF domain-containing protein [Armatimonadota bacterium]